MKISFTIICTILFYLVPPARQSCNPACDQVTAVCVDDEKEDRHCICYYGFGKGENNSSTSCEPRVNRTEEGEQARAWGHHRAIHLLEELLIMATYILIGGMSINLAGDTMGCKVTSALIQYLFLCVMAAFLIEGLFAYGVASGIRRKDGLWPVGLNYLLIVVIGTVPFAISFGLKNEHYGSNGIHCFCSLTTQAWAFFLPVVCLFFLAGICAESVNLDDWKLFTDTDLYQLHWSLKSAVSLIGLMLWLMLSYFVGLIAIDQQGIWVLALFQFFNFILGPLLFVVHTMGHYQTAQPLNRKFPRLPWYKDCHPPRRVPNAEKSVEPVKRKETEPEKEPNDFETFWKWVTNSNDQNIAQESENVLFNNTS